MASAIADQHLDARAPVAVAGHACGGPGQAAHRYSDRARGAAASAAVTTVTRDAGRCSGAVEQAVRRAEFVAHQTLGGRRQQRCGDG
ncbi:MAG: hypothetical protein ACK559_15820, partial [bacterium]